MELQLGPDVDVAAARSLRVAVATARDVLAEVAVGRRRHLEALARWEGPHARAHRSASDAALEAARTLDGRLHDLLVVLDAEVAAATARLRR